MSEVGTARGHVPRCGRLSLLGTSTWMVLGCRTCWTGCGSQLGSLAPLRGRAARRDLHSYLTARADKPSVIFGDLTRRSSKNFWTKPPAISALTLGQKGGFSRGNGARKSAGWSRESAGCMMQALDESWAMPHAHATELSQTGAGEAELTLAGLFGTRGATTSQPES